MRDMTEHLFNNRGCGEKLEGIILNKNWYIEVELCEGILQGYATCAKSADTYEMALRNIGYKMTDKGRNEVPYVVRTALHQMMLKHHNKLFEEFVVSWKEK